MAELIVSYPMPVCTLSTRLEGIKKSAVRHLAIALCTTWRQPEKC